MTLEQALDTYLRADYTLIAGLSSTSALTTSTVISQAANSIDRETGSFVTDGWVAGMTGYISDSGSNNHVLFTVTIVAALKLTVSETLTAQTKAQCLTCVLTRYYNTRINWIQEPESRATPYLNYQTIDDTDEPEYFGATDTGQARVQFSIVGTTKAAKDLLFRVRTLIRGKDGVIGGTGGCHIFNVEFGMLRENFNADTHRYVFMADYRIRFAYA